MLNKIIKTRITQLLGVEYPIFQGCMQWIARAELVGAVSQAGGIGVLSSSTFATAEGLHAEIQKVKSITSKPFAVNLTLLPSLVIPDYDGYLSVCAQEGVKLIETAGRIPKDDMIKRIKDAGMLWSHKCTTVKHTLKAQNSGCDMVVADGFECAGHPGETDIGTMVLTARCVEALTVPVVSAGGIGTGRQMAAALMLGAEGVYMGSRFLLSKECPVLDVIKNEIAEKATENDTVLALRSFVNTSRYYKTPVSLGVVEKEKRGCKFEEVAGDVAGKTACEMFFESGDVQNHGVICLGQVGGLIHDVLPVKEIVDGAMSECVAALSKFDA